MFCAGANIRMLGKRRTHKVNFCKFTNETRLAIEDASANSGQTYICAVNGTAAGGGYELALAADHIMLVDDGRSTVSLPETPLLAVLPGTGGLTRVTDKRKVRRDRADVFCTTEEGVRGSQGGGLAIGRRGGAAIRNGRRRWPRARTKSPRAPTGRPTPRHRAHAARAQHRADRMAYSHVDVEIDRARGLATVTLRGPAQDVPASVEAAHALGEEFWPLTVARELDDAILDLRFNELDIGVVCSAPRAMRRPCSPTTTSSSRPTALAGARDPPLLEAGAQAHRRHRAKSLVALIEPGSCFAGTLAELVFAADRSLMLIGTREGDNRPPAALTLGPANFGLYPMVNGLTRLESRFLGEPETLETLKEQIGEAIEAEEAAELGLVTLAYDDIDWDDEMRMLLEERASFSPDALTGMEANLRFGGPETMETKIFGRLTAWQNWIFQRPNAVGEDGALKRYGSGVAPTYSEGTNLRTRAHGAARGKRPEA